jgi:hypothetical protein
MFVQPLDGPLGQNSLPTMPGSAQGEGTLLQGGVAPAAGDNISRFVPPWFNQGSVAAPYAGGYGNDGSVQGLFGPLMGVLQQLMQMLQSLMGNGCNTPYGSGNCQGGGNERYFQNANGSSEGDPHLSFNGQKWLLAAWTIAGPWSHEVAHRRRKAESVPTGGRRLGEVGTLRIDDAAVIVVGPLA